MTIPPQNAPKPVTAAELQKLIDKAKNNPVEVERLQSNPETVLEENGLRASPSAVDFLKTLGRSVFHQEQETPMKSKRDGITDAGEA